MATPRVRRLLVGVSVVGLAAALAPPAALAPGAAAAVTPARSPSSVLLAFLPASGAPAAARPSGGASPDSAAVEAERAVKMPPV